MFRLEKLEINGFKSFPDRTTLVFGEGITAVVGPNGCGKSNLSEAVSWVLGEQSAKNLRGGKMEDVIFNGTRDRKPTGMAEVILTLVAIEDIAGRETGDSSKEGEDEYNDVVETAERAADAVRSLVEEQSAVGSEQLAVNNAELVSEHLPATETTQSGEEVKTPDEPLPTTHRPYRRRKRKSITISAGERITVGRRLYRTGDSDYLMNGRSCLLRDIQDLFAGTGLGGAHYAIIEQGRIGQILSSKPLDRRALIEEAAGITKFKSRKRAAELKLESAKQNLSRLNDIISEVERQVNSLKRQAQKARRYRRLREEMRGLLKLVFTADYYRLTEAADRVAIELEQAGLKQAELDGLVSERESEHRIVSMEARSAEDRLARLREQAAVVELEADRARNRRSFDEQQIRELTARIEELGRDQRELDSRLALLDQEAERRTADLNALEAEMAFEQAGLLEREEKYQAELAQLRQAESQIEQLRQRILTEIGHVERLRNMSANLEDALGRLDLKQTNLRAELGRARARRDEVSSEYLRVGGEAEGNRARLADLTNSIAERRARLDALRNQAIELRSQLEAVHTERTAGDHRLASLEDLDAHHAYYSDAVQHVLSPEQAARINALGTLADFVEVEPQYERLVESLFSRELQSVLVPTIDDALSGVESLKSEGLGRGAFLVVGLHGGEGEPEDRGRGPEARGQEQSNAQQPANDQHRLEKSSDQASINRQTPNDNDYLIEPSGESYYPGPRPLTPRGALAHPAPIDPCAESAQPFQLEVLRAVDLLGLKPAVKTVVERAFPDKCAASVVPDIEAALQLSIENTSRIYVTYEGEQVINGRLIVTGAQAGQKGSSLLGLKREIKQLRAQTEWLRGEQERFQAEYDHARGQVEQLEREASLLDMEVRQQEKTAAARDSQLEGLARDLERAEQHVRVVEDELEQAVEERAELESRIGQLAGELGSAESSGAAVEESLSRAQAAFSEMRAHVEQSSEELSAARAGVAARTERLQATRSEKRRIDGEAEELRSRINRNKLELYESHSRIEQLTLSQAEGDTATARFDAERASLAEQINRAAEALQLARARADELESLLTDLRQSSAAAHERRGQVEVERARIESEAEHLTRSCFSELAMSLEDVVEEQLSVASCQLSVETDDQADDDSHSLQSGEEGGQSAAPESEQQLATDHWQLTTDAKARLDELRVKLDDMGPVNMMALEELEESEERFRFLSEQRRDILDSIKLTEEALAEIRRRSRERFRHAFTHINQNFQRMFVELFGGGRGEMILIDEEDVLESGIDLIAQPPGKRLQNVLLLSGGEKAMAAIALVLAIFQYRPSPFCILDEVDAPLDEVNIGRFSEKIIEMSRDTQFLVITHNKRTMEAARALYGVTMEEPGISKLVSVKFE